MGWVARVLDVLIEAGIVGLLLFAPLPFGSAVWWAQAAIEGAVLLLVLLSALRRLAGDTAELHWTPLLWPAVAMTVLVALQLRLGGSINPHATRESFRLYLAFVGFLLVLGAHLTTRGRVSRLLAIQVAWGTLLALAGLGHRLARQPLPWLPDGLQESRLISTFINPNHQALYFEVVLFLALGLLLRPARTSRREAGETRASRSRPAFAAAALPRVLGLVGAIAVLGGALLLTLSRGGYLGVLAGFLLVAGLSLGGRAGRGALVTLGAALVGIAVFLALVGVEPVLGRFAKGSGDPFADYRWVVWERSVRILGDAPVLGVGLGTYEDAFPLYRPPGIVSEKKVDHAHNDYLELLTDTGVVGVIILGWALIGLAGFAGRRLGLRHDPFVRGLTLGGLGALTAIAVHSALDFGLHMPANALLATLVGVVLVNGVALRTHRGSGGGVDLPGWTWPMTARRRVVGVGLAALGVAGLGVLLAQPILAEWYFEKAGQTAGEPARQAGAVTMKDLAQAHANLLRAARLDPGNPRIQSTLADVAEDLALRIWRFGVGPDGRKVGETLDARVVAAEPFFASAYEAYEGSLRDSPRAARTHDRFAWFLGALEAVRQKIRGSAVLRASVGPPLAALVDSGESLLPRALASLREGIRLDPENPYRRRNLALFALAYLPPGEAAAVAAEGFGAAVAIEPHLVQEIVDRLDAAAAPRDLILASIPRREDLRLALARDLDRRGKRGLAAEVFEDALALVSSPTQEVQVRVAYGHSLATAGDVRGALDQAHRALVVAPKDDTVFDLLSRIYEATGNWSQATAALTSAITLVGDRDRGRADWYRSRLAENYVRLGQRDEALAVRRQLLRSRPADGEVHLALAVLLEEQGRWSEAEEEYRAATRLAPQLARVHAEAAAAYARHEMLPDSVTAYETALRIDPTQTGSRVELAGLYARLGDSARAAAEYRSVLAQQPDHEAARRGLDSLTARPAAAGR